MGKRPGSQVVKNRQAQAAFNKRARKLPELPPAPPKLEHNGQIVYLAQGKHLGAGFMDVLKRHKLRTFSAIGLLVASGFVTGRFVTDREMDQASGQDFTTCEPFESNVEQPKNKPNIVEVQSDIKFPAADTAQPDITEVFAYVLDTQTAHSALAGSCALMVTVSLDVNEGKFEQTQFAQYLSNDSSSGSELKIGHLFNTFNAGITDPNNTPEARQASYDNCISQVDRILSGIDARPELFSQKYFQPNFLRQTDPPHPRTRMDYAPYVKPSYKADSSPNPAFPTEPFQEIWLQDESGGAITCSSGL